MYTAHKVLFNDNGLAKDSFFCKLCKFVLVGRVDFLKNKEYECCGECYLTFVESRKDLWKEGWRPDKTALDEYIYKRTQLIIGVNNEF
tara:strand:- start:1051 stop:1314 length:264 start_codon:yes stop_codon:yes gene_type:complete